MQQTTLLNNPTLATVTYDFEGGLTINAPFRTSLHVNNSNNFNDRKRKQVLYAHDGYKNRVCAHNTLYYGYTKSTGYMSVDDYDKILKFLKVKSSAIYAMLFDATNNNTKVEGRRYDVGKKYLYNIEPTTYGIISKKSELDNFDATIVGFYGAESIFDTWTTIVNDIDIPSVEISEEEYNRFNEFIFDMVNETNNLILKYAR